MFVNPQKISPTRCHDKVHLQWIAGTSGYGSPHILDWINAASKGIRLWFGRIFMYLFFGGSIDELGTSVVHVFEDFAVAADIVLDVGNVRIW